MRGMWEERVDRRAMLKGIAGTTLGLAAVAGAGASAEAAATPKRGGTLAVGNDLELLTLDPIASTYLIEREIYYNIYESLLTMDTKANIMPGLATSYKASDPQTYVFTLRDDVTFQDGTKFDAGAAKWNLDRYIQTPGSYRAVELASVASVEARNTNTLVLHLKQADSSLLSQLVDRAGMMLSPNAVQKGGAGFKRNPVGAGSGPFQFKEWIIGDHLTIIRNPHYRVSHLPYLDTVIYHPITDLNASLDQLRSGSLDLVRTIAGKDVATVKSDSNLVYRQTPSFGYDSIQLNCGGAFSDPKKRQAVAMAIDRSQLERTVFFNVGPIGYGPIPPKSWAFVPSEQIYGKTDLKAARNMAGSFSFTLKNTNGTTAVQEAQLIQAQLQQAGITMNIQTLDSGTLTQQTQQHNFDAAFFGWSGRLDPDGNTYSELHTNGSFNWGQYSDPQVDRLLEQGRVETSHAKRKALYDQMQKTVVTAAPYIYLHFAAANEIHSKALKGFTLYPDGMNRFASVWKS